MPVSGHKTLSLDLSNVFFFNRWIDESPFGKRLCGKKQVGEFRGWRMPSGSQSMDNYVPGCMVIGDAVNKLVHKIIDSPEVKEAFTKQWYFEVYEANKAPP